jgi:hypothetical protein
MAVFLDRRNNPSSNTNMLWSLTNCSVKSNESKTPKIKTKNAIPLLKESSATLTEEITQLKLSVSIQRDTVDTHKAKVAKQAKLIKERSNNEDADLTISIEELQETLQILKGEFVSLDEAYKADMTRLNVFTNRKSL